MTAKPGNARKEGCSKNVPGTLPNADPKRWHRLAAVFFRWNYGGGGNRPMMRITSWGEGKCHSTFFGVSFWKVHNVSKKAGNQFSFKELRCHPLEHPEPFREGGGFHKKKLRKPGKHRKGRSLKTPPCGWHPLRIPEYPLPWRIFHSWPFLGLSVSGLQLGYQKVTWKKLGYVNHTMLFICSTEKNKKHMPCPWKRDLFRKKSYNHRNTTQKFDPFINEVQSSHSQHDIERKTKVPHYHHFAHSPRPNPIRSKEYRNITNKRIQIVFS